MRGQAKRPPYNGLPRGSVSVTIAAMTANGKSRWKMRAAFLFLLCIIALVLAGIALPGNTLSKEMKITINDLHQAKNLALACKLYADDNKGKFPDKLRNLVPDYIEAEVYEKWMFRSPEEKSVYEWSYFGGQSVNLPPTAILIASPVPWSNHSELRRIIAHSDGSGEFAREEDFQHEIKAQRQSMHAAAPRPPTAK